MTSSGVIEIEGKVIEFLVEADDVYTDCEVTAAELDELKSEVQRFNSACRNSMQYA